MSKLINVLNSAVPFLTNCEANIIFGFVLIILLKSKLLKKLLFLVLIKIFFIEKLFLIYDSIETLDEISSS